MANTITSADATFALQVTNLYPTAQILEGFSTDDMFSMDATEFAQTVRGADGKLSAGFKYGDYVQTITIMPDSQSREFFDTWVITSRTSLSVFRCNGTIIIPAIGKKYTLTNGVLLSAKLLPDAKNMLQAIPYKIQWESITGENYIP